MSNKVADLAWKQKLRSTTKFVLIALSDHANETGWCWPGKPLLAAKCGLTERSVQKALIELERLGLIEAQERFRNDGSQKSNGYHVLPLHFRPKDGKPTNTEEADPAKPGERHSPQGELNSSPEEQSSRAAEPHSGPPSTANSPLNPQGNPQIQPPPQPRKGEVPASLPKTEAASVSSKLKASGDATRAGLAIPDVIGSSNTTVAMRIIASLPNDQQQEVLDELSGRCRTSQVKNVLGYLRALVREVNAGTFTPDLAAQVRSDRETRARNLQAYEARLAGPPAASPAPPGAEARAKIQALIGRLAKPPTK